MPAAAQDKKTMLLLYGGQSTEHAISCFSAATIVRSLAQCEYACEIIGISKEGLWHLQDWDVQLKTAKRNEGLSIECDRPLVHLVPGKGFYAEGRKIPCDCVLPIIHGSNGEDGNVQGLLEHMALPYVGADVTASALALNKQYSKILWREAGLPVLPFMAINKRDYLENPASYYAEILHRFPFPIFVKPNSTGSSVGIRRIVDATDVAELQTAIEYAFLFDNKILIEQGISAREIEVSVIGNHRVQVFSPGELITGHEFYSYQAKYIDPQGATIKIPAPMDAETGLRIRELAEQAYRVLSCTGLARVDFFIEKDSDNIYLNEINTMPGFSSISMFPRMLAEDGMDLPQFLRTLIQLALERFSERAELTQDYSHS